MIGVDELKRRKEELKYSCREISQLSGVPLGTVQKIFSGSTTSPRRETLTRLEKVLTADKKREQGGTYATGPSERQIVREPAYAYGSSALSPDVGKLGKRQGEYTLDDYLALPDDQRYELIDGVLYDMAAPTSNHQEVAGYLYHKLMQCIEEHDYPCRPYISPIDVQLDKDDRTIVQPDVIVNCDPERNIVKRMVGAPDFVAEVLSPSSSNRDLIIKLNKYFNAGVREYWILDPVKKKVTVYIFGETADPREYSFEDDIPIGISEGKCTLSLKGVVRWLV